MLRVFSTLAILIITGCQIPVKKGGLNIEGRWQLTDYYADIGDGKENWRKPDKNHTRTIEFKPKGEFVDSDNPDLTRFVLRDSVHLEISLKTADEPFTWTIVRLSSDRLELRPSCIEGCGEKYKRIK